MASSPIAIALRAVSPKYILTIGPLSVGCCVLPSHPAGAIEIRGPLPSLFLFLFRSIRRPKRRVDGLPYTFHPFESSLQRPPHRRRYYLVGCYISLSNGGHRRPVLHPSLNFLMGAILAPQTKGPNAAHASPAAGRLYWAHWTYQCREWCRQSWGRGRGRIMVRGFFWCEEV